MKKLQLGVLFGGRSGEHEVSLMSARSVMSALDPARYQLHPIGITRDGRWLAGGDPMAALENQKDEGCCQAQPVLDPGCPGIFLMKMQDDAVVVNKFIKLDAVFPVLHGPFGEDGTVQGLLELAGLPYVGSGVLGSAAGMDKVIMKQLFESCGLPVAPYSHFNRIQWENDKKKIAPQIINKLGLPLFVKPANLGSSVGITKVKDENSFYKAIDLAFSYDYKVIVEAFAPGSEVECSVLGNENPQASLPGEIIPSNEFYDYQAKYIDNKSRLVIPAPLTPKLTKQVQELAVASFQAIDASGLARVDFFVDLKKESVVINEINTMPGFTAISMYPKLWEATGMPYSQLLHKLVQLALERQEKRRLLKTTYV